MRARFLPSFRWFASAGDFWSLAAIGIIAIAIVGMASGAGQPTPLFVVINPMTQGRENATATILPSGKVLVAGGQDLSGAAQGSAEVFDAATGNFNLANFLTTTRTMHTAVLLNNGLVLITGGIDSKDNVLNSAEIFDPASQTFTLLNGTMSDSREGHLAIVLPSGQVLIAGGKDAAGNVLNTAEIFDPGSKQFICIGGVSATPPACNPSMTDSRIGSAAVLLNDGSVLIVGGRDNGGNVTNTAERFVPAAPANAGAGVFHPVGMMSDFRVNHTATRLNDGSVLVTGGFDGFDVVASAEIFDPVAGTFHPVQDSTGAISSMSVPRQNHTGTLLLDGTVLLVGGSDNANNLLSSADIYDPTIGRFSPVASQMAVGRAFHLATLLSDGMVLIAGGATPGQGLVVSSETELFDPAPGTFVPTAPMVTSREFATASTLFNGSTIIAGGENAFGPLASTEVYDGSTFQPGPLMSTQRAFHAVTLFPKFVSTSPVVTHQFVLFSGGVDATGTVHADADLYDGALNLIQQSVPGGSRLNKMSHPRMGHTSTVLLIGGNAVLTGGMTSDGSVLDNGDVFNPTTGAFSASAGTMVSPRVFHTATQLSDGTVLLAGGRDGSGNILNTAELYNPVADSFAAAAAAMTDAREFHVATPLNSQQILITGGIDQNGATSTAEIYSVTAKTFTPVGRMSVARYLHSAVVLPDGDVLIAGGLGNDNLVVSQAEIFSPVAQTFRPAAGLMLDARAGATATLLQDGMILFAGGVDSGFNITDSAELYDPPGGAIPAAALVSVVKSVASKGRPGSITSAGSIRVSNLGASAENFTGLTLALSDSSIFSRIVLTGRVVSNRRRQLETAALANPGSTAVLTFRRPLAVPPGGSVRLTLTGALSSLRRAGASARHPVRSIQTATAVDVVRDSGPVSAQGLPAGFGAVTLR